MRGISSSEIGRIHSGRRSSLNLRLVKRREHPLTLPEGFQEWPGFGESARSIERLLFVSRAQDHGHAVVSGLD
jgi:hypothetical protein